MGMTNTGLAYIARQQANNQPVQMSHFVLAYIPDLDVMSTPDPDSGLPDPSLITGQFPIAREGYNNQDSITYTLELDSSVGDFDFNWYAIITDSDEVAAINFIYPVFKRAGIQQIVTRNFIMNYARAQEATGITIPAQTWQFDYTAQMANVESSIEAVNTDLQKTKDNINNRLLVHSNQLIDHTQQLQNHAQQIQSHGQLHNNHGQRLNGHDTTLGQHNDAININSTNINGHTALIEEHTRQINGQANLLTNHESRIADNRSSIERLNNQNTSQSQTLSTHTQDISALKLQARKTKDQDILELPLSGQRSPMVSFYGTGVAFRLTLSAYSIGFELTAIIDVVYTRLGGPKITYVSASGRSAFSILLKERSIGGSGYILVGPRGQLTVDTDIEISRHLYAGNADIRTLPVQSGDYNDYFYNVSSTGITRI